MNISLSPNWAPFKSLRVSVSSCRHPTLHASQRFTTPGSLARYSTQLRKALKSVPYYNPAVVKRCKKAYWPFPDPFFLIFLINAGSGNCLYVRWKLKLTHLVMAMSEWTTSVYCRVSSHTSTLWILSNAFKTLSGHSLHKPFLERPSEIKLNLQTWTNHVRQTNSRCCYASNLAQCESTSFIILNRKIETHWDWVSFKLIVHAEIHSGSSSLRSHLSWESKELRESTGVMPVRSFEKQLLRRQRPNVNSLFLQVEVCAVHPEQIDVGIRRQG